MIPSLSSVSNIHATGTTHSTQNPHPAKHKTSTPEDTIHLSEAALKAAAGDVDHDGDSH